MKVVLGSSRDAIAEWMDGTLKVRVRAQPEKGRANATVEKLLVERLQLSLRQVCITSGRTANRKVVEIEGLTVEEVLLRQPVHRTGSRLLPRSQKR